MGEFRMTLAKIPSPDKALWLAVLLHAAPEWAGITPFASAAAPSALESTLQIHPALEARLFAREPYVIDPVAACFDANGRMYVVEMRDYPYGIPPDNKPGGTIRLLEDRDRDGRADRSVLFAEKLSFPTSIAPYRDGVIVAAPPEIIYLRDADGNGQAEIREVLCQGFKVGFTDANMSGLRWGLDNWLHGVNGGLGGEVLSTRKGGAPLRLGDLDFRLQPDTGALETTYSTGGGFGLAFDSWGRSFTPHNVNHIQQRIARSSQLGRQPGLPPLEGTHSISDHEEMARIYPIVEAQTRVNHPEQAGHFSAAGGVAHIGHDQYPTDIAGSITVTDVAANIVHRDVLSADGPILKASRSPAETANEFIASKDPWFRPTGLELGPDGALYLLDMQREVIEHPEYIPAKMREKMNIRGGDDKGRIYRIVPKSGILDSIKPLAGMSPRALINEFASPNQWRRLTAQRLLVESKRSIPVAPLERMVRTHPRPSARIHALWTLAGRRAITAQSLLDALADADPRVVENVIQAAEPWLTLHPALGQRIRSLAIEHPDSRVRFVAVLAVPLGPDEAAAFLARDLKHRWSRLAAYSALNQDPQRVLVHFLRNSSTSSGGTTIATTAPADRAILLRELADLTAARGSASALDEVARSLVRSAVDDVMPVLEGLLTGLNRASARTRNLEPIAAAIEPLILKLDFASRRAVWAVQRAVGAPPSPSQTEAIGQALRSAADPSQSPAQRRSAIALLALAPQEQAVPVLLPLFDGATPLEVQSAALEVLRNGSDPEIVRGLLAQWRGMHPALRPEATRLLLRKRDYQGELLSALEDGRLKLGELNMDLEDRRRLLRWSTPEIQTRAVKLLGDGEYGNRQAKVDEWLAKLPPKGDAANGRAIFERTCAQCHRSGQLGHEVGPNLTGLSHRSVEDLIANTLDPNMAINPNYLAVEAETADGDFVSGILAGETAAEITLLQAQGLRTTLRRNTLKRVNTSGSSLMPDGLESGLQPKDLRDLVEFIQMPQPN